MTDPYYRYNENMFVGMRLLNEFRLPARKLDYFGWGGLAPATKPQRAFLHSLCRQLGVDEEDLPYHITSLRDLTLLEATEVIEMLKQELEQRHRDDPAAYHYGMF